MSIGLASETEAEAGIKNPCALRHGEVSSLTVVKRHPGTKFHYN